MIFNAYTLNSSILALKGLLGLMASLALEMAPAVRLNDRLALDAGRLVLSAISSAVDKKARMVMYDYRSVSIFRQNHPSI